MLIRIYANWMRFADNGVWEDPHFINSRTARSWFFNKFDRAKIIDDVIYIMPAISYDEVAYKIDLARLRDEVQDRLIDELYPIIE